MRQLGRSRRRGPAFVTGLLASVLLLVVSGAFTGCGVLDEFERQVAADIEDNPVILEHIGDIESIETDWTATGEEPGDDVFVFRLKGSKGDGLLTAECITVDADHEDVVSGSLKLPSGTTIDLFDKAVP